MEKKFCQSCAMPLNDENLFGSDKNGDINRDFCTYCYQKGEFTQDVTMDEMIDICVPHMKDAGMDESQARDILNKTLPGLSRWSK